MDELFSLFEEIGLPYFRQGGISDEEYEPEFFTYWNINTSNISFYDNVEHRYIIYIQIGYYTNDAEKVYTGMENFIKKAKEKGFICDGRAKDADSGKDSFFGRVCYIRIIKKA